MKKSFPIALALVMFLSSCGGNATITVDPDAVIDIQTYNKVAKKGDAPDPKHGVENSFAYGALSGVNGNTANGVAYMTTYADGVSVVTANLNTPMAPSGKKYLVWTADADGGTAELRGSLTSIVGDTRHSLRFETTDAASTLMTVVITLEPDSAAHDQPGSAVAAGTMKEVQ